MSLRDDLINRLQDEVIFLQTVEMKEEAFELMNEGVKRFRYPYYSLLNNPFYDNLRGDPRFEEIVQKTKERHEERLKTYGDL